MMYNKDVKSTVHCTNRTRGDFMDINSFGDMLNTDIFNFDNEQNILNLMLMYFNMGMNDVRLFKENSFERKILRFIQNIRSFTENNGHDCPPPDYYSDEFSCMFDVLRINDSEVKKTYNPIISQEQQMRKEYKKEGLLDSPYFQVAFEAATSGDVNEHSFPKYKKQAQRVIKEHIDKIPLWIKEHPSIQHKGLLVFDETGLCFEETKAHVKDDYFSYTFNRDRGLIIHETWNDIDFIQPIYESKLDFVIWFNPYKNNNEVLYNYNMANHDNPNVKYPAIIIVDTRFKRTEYIKYNYAKLVMAT